MIDSSFPPRPQTLASRRSFPPANLLPSLRRRAQSPITPPIRDQSALFPRPPRSHEPHSLAAHTHASLKPQTLAIVIRRPMLDAGCSISNIRHPILNGYAHHPARLLLRTNPSRV